MAKHFNLDGTSLNEQDWLRQVVIVFLHKLDPDHNVCSDETIALHDKWLAEIVEPRFKGLKHLKNWVSSRWQVLHDEVDSALPTIEWFSDLGLVIREGVKSTYLHEFIARVTDAGLTQVVSLNGWRESEYGWSLQDIHITRNRDALDQHTIPFRYSVKWVVPKTHGEAKLNREITQSTYQATQQLVQLTMASSGSPALYPSHNLKAPEKSGETIKNRVANLWRHFVDYYTPFVQLDKAQALNKLQAQAKAQVLTHEKKQQLTQLSKESEREGWARLLQDRLLI
ncbi:hypothetical protein L1D55_09710 [Vibrio sp. Isolate22]|uniref:hypothetical protein n=1 Tax=Vibrio sp. Isolate22 TaxID=2908532 RepID=UPI001EFC5DC3|nr:hypothetical protein [Vibrio sp. Isolate22]MCG9692022.1 hypothetical protein [Vibrio sp. Isolate22]